jgi:hypothetical protein
VNYSNSDEVADQIINADKVDIALKKKRNRPKYKGESMNEAITH